MTQAKPATSAVDIRRQDAKMEQLFMQLSSQLDRLPEDRRPLFLAKLCLLLADRLEDEQAFAELVSRAADNPRRTK
jgi:hypothetical protein